MPGCAVSICKNYNRNTKGTGIQYFRFPKNEQLNNKWIQACRRKETINLKNACICSEHFDETCLEIPLKHRLLNYFPKNLRLLKSEAVPTRNLPHIDDGPSNSPKRRNEEHSLVLNKKQRHLEEVEILKSLSVSSVPSTKNNMNINVEVEDGPILSFTCPVNIEIFPILNWVPEF
ncbi:hypothetical protein ABEB36_014940 [Hypothenemus hampei]|uniref:THAP-type domain-containing protein n=1 Tax=Hypothenemus hampei TaxID=57062 RepID=A0ABD1E1C1_HYPHA